MKARIFLVSFLLIIVLTVGCLFVSCTGCSVLLNEDEDLRLVRSDDGTYYMVFGNGSSTVDGDVVIPSTYKDKPVKGIAPNAFFGCTGLTSVTIPGSVKSIGSNAFRGCTGLTSVTIPDGVTSIGFYAFSGCTGLTSVTIPDSVKSIEHNAFEDCTGLTSVTIGNGLTSIELDAFSGCTGLTSITVDEKNAVYHSNGNCLIETATGALILGCQTSVIPTDGSVTSIEARAFSGCTELTAVTIPNSVKSIEHHAFYKHTGLTSVTIPDSVTSIGREAFSGCTNLETIVYLGTEEEWNAVTKDDDWNYRCSAKVVFQPEAE